jgi:RNA ligase (TIGR02306 family)
MADSTHKVEVVPVVLEKHPNADRLSVAKVFGYTCVTETSQWIGQLAAYIPPDSLVDTTRPEFLFLATEAKYGEKGTLARVKAKRLRGVQSFGLLVPAPNGVQLGEDIADLLQVTHYDPPIKGTGTKPGLRFGGEIASGPNVYHVKYDVEAGRRYADGVFVPGELVVATEKIHGANARYVFHDGRMYCGSRIEWKKEYPSYDHVTSEFLAQQGVSEDRAAAIIEGLKIKNVVKNLWWQALDATPTLRAFCESHPGVVVYGEVYGAVQDLNYGCKPHEVRFAAFDVMENGVWLDFDAAWGLLRGYDVPFVSYLFRGEYDFDKMCELADGPSVIPGTNHIREGVVVVPIKERWDHRVGRVKLKWVSAAYLERSK